MAPSCVPAGESRSGSQGGSDSLWQARVAPAGLTPVLPLPGGADTSVGRSALSTGVGGSTGIRFLSTGTADVRTRSVLL
jgi:hypothetical protein